MENPPSFDQRPAYPGIGKAAVNAARFIVWRTRTFGVRSGLLTAYAYAVNAVGKVRNRLARRPGVSCPCCGWSGAVFRLYGMPRMVVPNLECPQCGSHDRQRFFQLFVERRGAGFLAAGRRVLHCAPEPHVKHLLERAEVRRFAMDLNIHAVARETVPALVGDLVRVPLADGTLDGAVLLHVVEHIADDRAVFAELARVLRPGGSAAVMVPVWVPLTETDDWGYPDPAMFDHYRTYTPADFHMRCAPLTVEIVHPSDLLSPEEVLRYAIRDSEIVFLCHRPE